MSKCENNWQYSEQYPVEPESISKARRMSLECGVEPVSRATAAYLSALTIMTKATSILEIGTGVGVSGLALIRHQENAHLTSIDLEAQYHTEAKSIFQAAEISPNRLRLITGNAKHILPKLNRGAYDLALIDADPDSLISYVEDALLIVKAGGTIVIPHILNGGKVSNPAARDENTVQLRDLLSTVADSQAVVPMLLPVGDGVLTLSKHP